ncbi:MAG: 2-oxoglutarate oxidoreductase [Candidatus Omnitrophica bacterium]|nr:2-oxoglutarate oxidoreductase [Candidatus Omnitrophota bacterium]
MTKNYKRTESLYDVATHYCAGCGHGILHRIVAEAIDELGVREKTIAIAPVGCAVIAYDYWRLDCAEAAHGRALAVATAIKRVQPDKVVFTYQGDGDLAAIGTAETIHAANRGENLTVIFVNNAVYGMTGGQMAPTTLLSQKTATTPLGRDAKLAGYPLKISEMLALLDGVYSVERTSVSNPKEVFNTKRAIKQAFENQIQNKGFSMVEVLSMCPTYWDKTPVDAAKWIEDHMSQYFKLGKLK